MHWISYLFKIGYIDSASILESHKKKVSSGESRWGLYVWVRNLKNS